MSQIQTSNWSETAASNNASPPNGAPEGWSGTDVNNVVREIMSAIKIEYNRAHATLIAGGAADAMTLTYGTAPSAYTSGMLFLFYKDAADNATTTPTLNVNGLGAKTIVKRDGSTALSAADMKANALYAVTYDGTNFRLHATGI